MNNNSTPTLVPTPEPTKAPNINPQPEQQPVASTPPKTQPQKSKLPKILGIIFAAGAIIGIIAACIYFLFAKTDPVTDAILNTFENDRNIVSSGTLVISPDEDDGMGLSDIKIDFNVTKQAEPAAASATITLSTEIEYLGEINLSANAVVDEDKNIYAKLTGIDELSDILQVISTSVPEYSSIIDTILSLDGQWIMLPNSYFDLDDILDNISESSADSDIQCLIDGLKETSAKDIYKENPFIVGNTDNLKIQKKSGDLYRLSIDSDKLAEFAQQFSNAFSNCGVEIAEDELLNDSEELPDEIYIEISDDKITRLYVSGGDGEMEATLDLSFTYPETVDITIPKNYLDTETFLTGIFSALNDYDYSYDYDDYGDLYDYDDLYDYSDSAVEDLLNL